jgi:hypothetical protein
MHRGYLRRVRHCLSQLQLNHIRRKPLLIEQRARHAAESMTRHLFLRVPETPKRGVDRVVRHRTRQREQRREDILFEASESLQLAQDRNGLAGERTAPR